ncbi:MAG TPA: hypothetical protein VKQ32_14495 [Polyangia bacterium]|nr:hypothetical protein [Polyangia bacterium]
MLAAAVAGLAAALSAGAARAYTFVDELPEDACARARAYDPQDSSDAAQHARRACRLENFDQHLAERRSQQVAAEQEARDAAIEKWMVGTQPARVINPIAVELFAGSGIINYGAAISWNVLRQLELAAHIGQRQMDCATSTSSSGGNCTRTTWSIGARWILGDRDFAPFGGVAFSSTHAPLKINHYDQQAMTTTFLDGKGIADSGSLSAGVQLAVSQVRLSLEYIFEYVFFTGATLNDMQRPSPDLRSVWNDSLKQDRHGVRFQVGFAF